MALIKYKVNNLNDLNERRIVEGSNTSFIVGCINDTYYSEKKRENSKCFFGAF